MSAVEVISPALRELVAEDAELEQIASGCTFTEGPVWTNRDGGSLLFSDMPGDTRRRWTKAGGVEVLAHPSNKGNGLSYDLEGRLLICEHTTSSLIRIEADGSRTVLASHWQGKELNSPNDVVVASDGSIIFTDPPYGRWPGFGIEREQELDFCGVFRVSPEGELSLLVDDFQKPNGLCFSPDERTLWINDTDGGHIRRFSVGENHALSGGEVIYQMEGFSLETGIPDGQKLDANGNLWVSGPGGLHVVSGEGELLGRILTPENVGNQAWGGEDWKTLFICTSSTVHTLRTTVAAHRTPTMN
jgi:gluconolactonase